MDPKEIAASEERASRLVGWVMAVPGLALLAFGAWTLQAMMSTGVYSYRALLCSGLIGGGLTFVGLSKALGGRRED